MKKVKETKKAVRTLPAHIRIRVLKALVVYGD